MEQTVIVFEADTRAEAEMVLELLNNMGIAGHVQSDDLGGLRPDVAFATGGARICVAPGDEAKAREIILGLQASSGDATTP